MFGFTACVAGVIVVTGAIRPVGAVATFPVMAAVGDAARVTGTPAIFPALSTTLCAPVCVAARKAVLSACAVDE